MKMAQGLCMLAALATLVGCGKPDPVNESHTGELAAGDSVHPTDNSFYDEYTFKGGEGYTATITMQSTAFDSYLHLLGPNGETVGPNGEQWQNDDIAQGNLNAQIVTRLPVTGEYKVWANARSQNEVGAYTVTIQTTPGS